MENNNEVFHADDRPYGSIEGTVLRDDAPDPGPGVRSRPGLVTEDDHTTPERRPARPATISRFSTSKTHPVDEMLPGQHVPLRPAARDEHVRRRRRGAADRRHRARPAVRRPGVPAHRGAAGVRARHPAADPRRAGGSARGCRWCRAPRSPPSASMLAIGETPAAASAGCSTSSAPSWSPGWSASCSRGVFNRLLHFFPPVVTGSVITVIGISLLPVAIRWAGGGGADSEDFGSRCRTSGSPRLTL